MFTRTKKKSLPEKVLDAVTQLVEEGQRKAPSPKQVSDAIENSPLGAVARLGKPVAVVVAMVGANAVIKAVRGGGAPSGGSSSDVSEGAGLTAKELRKLTRDDLYEMAQKLDVDGRSDMNKAQLVAALAGRASS